ncbi:MAG: hypothetical protein J5590_09670 [Clostridia bacterium]|nr:hypothetical protein [Clostridia bacterium]
MKKLLSIFVAALMILTICNFTAMAAEDLFDVAFIEGSNIFVVTAKSGLTGINNVALMVRDSGGNVVYMDVQRAIKPGQVYFQVDLGDNLNIETYTFIVTSDGDTCASQTKTCSSNVHGSGSGIDPIYSDSFFNVSYDASLNRFVVNGELTKSDGSPAFNRIALLVYEPEANGVCEIYSIDALNEYSGPFTFNVPIHPMAPAGTYTFIVSSDGDVVTSAIKTCGLNDNFETHGTIAKGSSIGATYTLAEGEEAPMVIIAVYKENRIVSMKISDIPVNGKVTAEIEFGANEDTSGYSAKAFVWENFETLKPIKSARSLG